MLNLKDSVTEDLTSIDKINKFQSIIFNTLT